MENKVTIGILTYNHERFIKKCLESALTLSYGNLEIIISDDASTDKTVEVIKSVLNEIPTDHQIILNVNKGNLGLAGNFNKTFHELATGDYFITLGGDDMFSGYDIDENLLHFKSDEKIMMVDFNAQVIDENDIVKGPAATLSFDQQTFDINDYLSLSGVVSFAPGRMIKKELITEFPPISLHCPTEDSVLVVRSLLLGKLLRVNKMNILYRRHSANVSSSANLRKLSNIRIISQYIKDSISIYDRNIISDHLLVSLLKRFEYEFKRREIIYSNLGKYNKIIRRKLLQFNYKF